MASDPGVAGGAPGPSQSEHRDPAGDHQTAVSRVEAEYRQIVEDGTQLPLPGAGRTAERFDALGRWAGRDLSLGRLGEGHVDALAILSEAGNRAHAGAGYGVWAARARHNGTAAVRGDDGWLLTGVKEFCSGAELLDRALVTADAPDGYRLFDVDLGSEGISVAEGSWRAVGLADSTSSTVGFSSVSVPDDHAVGEPAFYTARPGFWFGGAGVAACWFGGARALVEHVLVDIGSDAPDTTYADAGRAVASVRVMTEAIEQVARAIDADPTDREGRARYRTLAVREAVHTGCVAVLEHVASAGGARPLGHDRDQSRRAADLYVYLSQHHGGADAAALGRAAVDGNPWS